LARRHWGIRAGRALASRQAGDSAKPPASCADGRAIAPCHALRVVKLRVVLIDVGQRRLAGTGA
jgi:hypothetical protein